MLIRFVLYLTSTNLRLLRWISSFCVCVWFRWYTIFHILIHDCFGAFSLLSLFLPMSLGSGGQIHVRTPYFDSCCSNTQNKSQSLYQSKDVSDGCFFLFNRQISIHFQFPIPIGNNRFYRKWFEEPSTLFDSTRHSEFTDRNLLIDLPFSTSLSLSLSFSFITTHSIHAIQYTACNVIELLQIDILSMQAPKSLSLRCSIQKLKAHTEKSAPKPQPWKSIEFPLYPHNLLTIDGSEVRELLWQNISE